MAETRAEETTRAATEPDTEESSRGAILSVLRIPSFRWLIADNAFGATGFQAITMIQAWVVLELTDSDAWVGAVNGLPAIPAAVVVLFAGVMADRIDRRVLLVWGRIAMAVIGLAMGLLVAAGVVGAWQLLLLATVFTIARVVAVVASQTLVVDVVGRKTPVHWQRGVRDNVQPGLFCGSGHRRAADRRVRLRHGVPGCGISSGRCRRGGVFYPDPTPRPDSPGVFHNGRPSRGHRVRPQGSRSPMACSDGDVPDVCRGVFSDGAADRT